MAPDNPVRIVEAFVDELDLAALGFAGDGAGGNRPPGLPSATLLKIYVYGYLNRVRPAADWNARPSAISS